MNLIEELNRFPGARVEPVVDLSAHELRPRGLPPEWRRIRAGYAGGQPAVTWLDSAAVDEIASSIGNDGDAIEPAFVSSAILMGWTISGLHDSTARVGALASEITEDVHGWTARDQLSVRLGDGAFSIRLLGTMESPFGPLVSNIHNIVFSSGDLDTTLIQLAVTATQDWSSVADDIVLDARPGWD